MTHIGLRTHYSFMIKVAAAMAVVGLGDLLFFQWDFAGGYLGLFGLAMLFAMVMARRALWHDWRALLAVAAAALYCGAMIFDASFLAWLLFLIAATMAALLPASGRFDDGWRWFQRLFLHGLRAPFAPIIDAAKVLKVRRARATHRSTLQSILPIVMLPLIGSIIIIALFAAANPVIAQFFTQLRLPTLSGEMVGRMIMWSILFIAAWSLIRPRLARRILPTFDGTGDLKLAGVSVQSVRLSLILFNLLFAIQNAMDVAYLSGVMPMPSGVTLADYAHRGAYPLIVTALLAAAFVLVTLRPGSSTAAVPMIRNLVVVWIVQNLMLVVSSMVRTWGYIEAYSLTVLRISALLWMALVGVGLILIGWRLLRGKSAGWLINTNLAAAAAILSIVCFVDLGEVAARWNVRHAREVGGTGAAMDLCYLNHLGGSAIGPLIELEQRPDLHPAFRTRVQWVRQDLQHQLRSEIAYAWTIRRESRLAMARQWDAAMPNYPKPIGARSCDGTLLPPPPTLPAEMAPAPSTTAINPSQAPLPASAPNNRGSALTEVPSQ